MVVTRIHKVMIDPGHGGKDPGNVNLGLREKDTTFCIADRIGHYVRKLSTLDAGIGPQVKPLFTRPNDCYLGIDVRAAVARTQGCELMLSIHTDSSLNILANGANAYVSAHPAHQQTSEQLGNELLAELAKCGLKNRGVLLDSKSHVGSLGVLRETCASMDAVLVEVGFASNLHDRKMLTSAVSREVFAAAIARAVVRHFGIEPAAN